MKRFLLFLLVGALAASIAKAEPLPGQQLVGPNDVLRGSFTELHHAKGVDQPNLITGHVVVAPATGLIWAMDKPLPTWTIVTRQAMVQTLGNIPIAQVHPGQAPYIFELYDDLCAALNGDRQALNHNFKVNQRQLAGGGWELDLTPLPVNAKVIPFQTITITGHRYIDVALLTKASGDFERFAFTDMTTSLAPVSAVEAAAFGLIH